MELALYVGGSRKRELGDNSVVARSPRQPQEGRRASYHSSWCLRHKPNSTDRFKLMKLGFSGLLYLLWILPRCKTQFSSGGNRAWTWGKGSELRQAGHEGKCQCHEGGHTPGRACCRSYLVVPRACQCPGDVWAMPSVTRFSLRSALEGPGDACVPLPADLL